MLFGSTVLEAAIGLALVYLLLSLICSAVQEVLAQLLALRSTTLFAGIKTMLTPDLAKDLYTHPLINTQYRQGWFDRLMGRHGMPSYIAADTFVATLLDALQAKAVGSPPFSAAFTASGAPSPPAGPALVEETILAIPDDSVRHVLLLLLDSAEGDYEKFKLRLAHWYDDTMDRVSGWYKRKVQLILLVIGLVVTLALGIDTISMSTAMWKEPTLRAEAVAVAQQTVKQTTGGATGSSRSVQDLNRQLNALQLPMGWATTPSDYGAWAIKILGFLLTTFAVSLGAPFWFGVLSKLVNIRGTGPVPHKAPTP